MKRRSPGRALLWLLLIPGQLIAGVLFTTLGIMLDGALFSSVAAGDAQGHGMPAFTILFGLIAIVVTIIVWILAVVLTIVRYRAIKKQNRNASEPAAAQAVMATGTDKQRQEITGERT